MGYSYPVIDGVTYKPVGIVGFNSSHPSVAVNRINTINDDTSMIRLRAIGDTVTKTGYVDIMFAPEDMICEV